MKQIYIKNITSRLMTARELNRLCKAGKILDSIGTVSIKLEVEDEI